MNWMASACKASWSWMGHNKDQLSLVFAVLAGVTALAQYKSAVNDGRKKETLKYIERSQDARVSDARSTIARAFLNEAFRRDYDASRIAAAVDKQGLKRFEEFLKPHGLDGPLLILVEHYTNLADCVTAEVCERQLACDFFAAEITGINNTFRPLINEVWVERDGQNHMARAMAFVNTCKK